MAGQPVTSLTYRLGLLLLVMLLRCPPLVAATNAAAATSADAIVPVLTIDDDFQYSSLRSHLAIFIDDADTSLTPEQFTDLWHTVPWRDANAVKLDMYARYTYWLALPLQNLTSHQRLLVLNIPSPRVFDWGAYWVSDGKVQQIYDRLRIDGNASEPLEAPTPALPLQLESHEKGVLLFRMTGRPHYLIHRSTLSDYRT
jgi:hypothetical protein